MLRQLWDWLFVRSQWTLVKEIDIYNPDIPSGRPVNTIYVLQNQWGEIKKVKAQ